MNVLEPRPLGATGLVVPPVCVGTSPLASMPELYGHEVDERKAVDTVVAALTGPLTFIDTSNGYGRHGEAERRIGLALRELGGLPDGVVVATKADPAPGTDDFSGERVRRSFAESLQRLGLERVPLLHLHDPERIPFEQAVAPGGPVDALVELREQGLVDRIGVAGGPVALMRRYLGTGCFDVLLNHNRYTLLDRSAAALLAWASARGIGVLNAAPYGSGMLAKPGRPDATYFYGPPSDRVRRSVAAMAAACAAHGIPLPAAALQFSMRSPHVDSTVVGMSSAERVAATVAAASAPIPEALWAELDRHVLPETAWLDPPAASDG